MDKGSSHKDKTNIEPKTIHPKLERTKAGLFELLRQSPEDNSIKVSHSIGKPISLTIAVPGHHADGLGDLLNKKFEAEGLPVRLQMDAIRSDGETTYALTMVPQEEYPQLNDVSARRFARFFVNPEESESLSHKHLVHYDAADIALTALPRILKDIRQKREYNPEDSIQA